LVFVLLIQLEQPPVVDPRAAELAAGRQPEK